MPGELAILLIEDDADDIDFLKDAFRENKLDVSIEVLNRGDLINKYLEAERPLPHLIVMDLNLPMLHGREVLCRIRENHRFNTVPIAVVSTSSLEEDVSFCLQAGADRFFSKPSSPAGFASLVKELYKMGLKS